MIKVATKNIGKTDIDVTFADRCDVYGPSGAGKTTLVQAIALAVLGRPTAATYGASWLRAARGSVDVTVLGRRFVRTMGSTVSQVSIDGAARVSQIGAADLVPVAVYPDLARVILSADALWAAASSTKGRDLRDIVQFVLPEVPLADIVTQRMTDGGHVQRVTDPTDEAAARKMATDARSRADRYQGVLDERITTHEALKGTMPVRPDVMAAAERVDAHRRWEAARAWADYDEACATAEAEYAHALAQWEAGRDKWAERARDWDARVAALGECPQRVDVAAIQGQLWVADQRLQRARADYQRVKADQPPKINQPAVDNLQAIIDAVPVDRPSTCPTCGGPPTDAVQRHYDRLVDAGERATTMMADLLSEHRQKVDSWKAQNAVEIEFHKAEGKKAREAEEIEQKRLKSAVYQNSSADKWQRARSELGARPVDGPYPVPAPLRRNPKVPSMARPDPMLPAVKNDSQIEDLLTIDDDAWNASQKKALDAIGAAAKAIDEAVADVELLVAEHERLEALVLALRVAPTIAAEQQLAQLIDAGQGLWGATVDGDSWILTIQGRPWHRASTGEKVVAGALFRAWLRAQAADRIHGDWARWPIIVDDAQSWSDGWPHIAAPVVWLWTDADGPDGLQVCQAQQ